MYDALHNALHNLQATGPEGFEGVVHGHLSRLTGRRFFLAKSGTQLGKDASTGGFGETYVDFECKRYRKGRSPDSRDLLGGLNEAIVAGGGFLDLWIVVSTGVISNADAEILRRAADQQAVAVEIFDWQESGLPELAVLCATQPQETLSELSARMPGLDTAAIAAELQEIRNAADFAPREQDLCKRVSAAHLGFDHTRVAANTWIETHLQKKNDAMAAFNQALCVGDNQYQNYVDRPQVQSALSTWYAGWSANQMIAAVLGPEGTGKSWATMGWWRALSLKPLTLLVTSNRDSGMDGLALIASAITRQVGVRDRDYWQRRVKQWLLRAPSTSPLFLVVLDGLNELPRHAWDQLFTSFGQSFWACHLAIVTTCRPKFWSDSIAPALPEGLGVTAIDVRPFDDGELNAAWGSRRPSLSTIDQSLREFIRAPRIFRLACHRLDRLSEHGDLTIERLQIEDWQDRRLQKLGFAHTTRDFNNLVIGIAADLRKGLAEFEHEQLRNYSGLARRSPDRNLDRDFDEIADGQLFELVDPVSERYRVRPTYAGLALGMLLAREARDESRGAGLPAVEALLAEALDPTAGCDQGAEMLRGACVAACFEPGYPTDVRCLLFHAWVTSRNLDEERWTDFAAYLPLVPDTYFDLAEVLWTSKDFHVRAREWLADAILRWRDAPEVKKILAERCVRWLGNWNPEWFPFISSPPEGRLERQREEAEHALASLTPTERTLSNRLISQTEGPHGPWIARLALLLISHTPRSQYVDGFIGWALSRAVMGLPDEFELIAWCLRLNEHDPEETETALLTRLEPLMAKPSEVGLRAIRSLLEACGTGSALTQSGRIPPPAPSNRGNWYPRRLLDVDPLDPSATPPAGLDRVVDTLATGVNPEKPSIALSSTLDDHRLEEMQPILARFAPAELAAFYRRELQTAAARDSLGIRQLAWTVPQSLMIITPDEMTTLNVARRALIPALDEDRHDARAVEAYLLAGVLGGQSPESQVAMLLERPSTAQDLLLLEDLFAPAAERFGNDQLEQVSQEASPHELSRLLWFLSRSRFPLNVLGRGRLVECFSHRDASVRSTAFRLAWVSNDEVALRVHLDSDWRAQATDGFEAFYGSLALIDAPGASYRALRERIVPELLGYLAEKEGTPEAIGMFAADLDALWRIMAEDPFEFDEKVAPILTRDNPSATSIPELEITGIESHAESSFHTIRVFERSPSEADVDRVFDWDRSIRERQDFERLVKDTVARARRAGHRFLPWG